MSILSLLGVSDATAATAAQQPHAGASGWISTVVMLLLFVGIFYFLLVRPQSKRAKEHRRLLGDLSVGDEVLTTGGIAGEVKQMKDNFIEITIAKDVNITVQKNSIANVLPKGTLDFRH